MVGCAVRHAASSSYHDGGYSGRSRSQAGDDNETEAQDKPSNSESTRDVLKRLYNLARRDRLLAANPCDGKILPKLKEQSSILYIEEEAFPALLQACDNKRYHRLRRAIIVAVGTGMRAGEQFRMKRSAVNLQKGTLALTSTKTRRTRYLAISEPVAAALREQLETHSSEWVWPGKSGRFCDATALNRSFQRALERAKLPVMSWHKLRHTFGTWSAGAGADILSVKEAMGHDSLTTTQVYTQVNASRIRNVFDLVGLQISGSAAAGNGAS